MQQDYFRDLCKNMVYIIQNIIEMGIARVSRGFTLFIKMMES